MPRDSFRADASHGTEQAGPYPSDRMLPSASYALNQLLPLPGDGAALWYLQNLVRCHHCSPRHWQGDMHPWATVWLWLPARCYWNPQEQPVLLSVGSPFSGSSLNGLCSSCTIRAQLSSTLSDWAIPWGRGMRCPQGLPLRECHRGILASWGVEHAWGLLVGQWHWNPGLSVTGGLSVGWHQRAHGATWRMPCHISEDTQLRGPGKGQ